jgi:hypothetical protein
VATDSQGLEVVRPGHLLYNYDEESYEEAAAICCICGANAKYWCCSQRWCRVCLNIHLNVAHRSKLAEDV